MEYVGIGLGNGVELNSHYLNQWWHSLLKGSNMIVCVLLVSNSRGCCLAAPGDHEGAVRGETTPEGVWHQQYTHKHVWSRL